MEWLRPFKLSRDQRLFFLISSLVQWLGLYLSDFQAHWILFVPPAFFLGAALNGYCSMMIVTRLLVGTHDKSGSGSK